MKLNRRKRGSNKGGEDIEQPKKREKDKAIACINKRYSQIHMNYKTNSEKKKTKQMNLTEVC